MTSLSSQIHDLARRYQPPVEAREVVAAARLVMIAGPIAAGKDSIMDGLLSKGGYGDVVTYTTRLPRRNNGVLEKDGVDYHFISEPEMLKMIQEQAFIEVDDYVGQIHATSLDEVRRVTEKRQIGLGDVEVNGIASYKALSSDVKAVFIVPPSAEELLNRLQKRHGEDALEEADVHQRLAVGIQEIEQALAAGYFIFVINDDLDKAIEHVDAIAHGNIDVAASEKARKCAEKLLTELKQHIES